MLDPPDLHPLAPAVPQEIFPDCHSNQDHTMTQAKKKTLFNVYARENIFHQNDS